MTHPLTDEICLLIDDSSMIDEDDWRGYMRAGADWQLEADAEWWKIILNKAEFLPPHAVDYIIKEFKQPMNHPLTEEESDKYLQMGWNWAFEQVIRVWDDLNTEAFDDGEQLILAFDQYLKTMRPTQEHN